MGDRWRRTCARGHGDETTDHPRHRARGAEADEAGGRVRTMDVRQVIEIIDRELAENGRTGSNALTPGGVIMLYRAVWMEHVALPDLPVSWIATRHITGMILGSEVEWWVAQRGTFR